MSDSVYKNYTSTSVLADVDVEKFTQWSHRYFAKFILPHLPIDTNSAILEIGCGYGRYTGYLMNDQNYKNIIGVDISEEQIEFAKQHYHLNNVFCEDAISFLEKEKKKYKAIILMDVLEHLELPYAIKLLKLINESLEEGGRFIIQVPNGLSPMKPIFYGDVTHVRAFSPNSMTQLLRMAEFSKFNHYAMPPLITGIKSLIHYLLWRGFVNPLLKMFMLLSHGSTVGGIYSSNLLTVVTK